MSFSNSKVGHLTEPPVPVGQALFEGNLSTNLVTTWTCPADVFSVCVVCVGAGGARSVTTSATAGGALAWKNNIPVTPQQTYAVQVGKPGSPTFFINTSTVCAESSTSASTVALFVGDGGGMGGAGDKSGGGGAGGYSGNGTAGGSDSGAAGFTGVSSAATGGAASGGAGGARTGTQTGYEAPGGTGGGTGLQGEGASGAAATGAGQHGNGGSGGANGSSTGGGKYGGGGGQSGVNFDTELGIEWEYNATPPGIGGLRIIWGPNRAFPSTNTQDM